MAEPRAKYKKKTKAPPAAAAEVAIVRRRQPARVARRSRAELEAQLLAEARADYSHRIAASVAASIYRRPCPIAAADADAAVDVVVCSHCELYQSNSQAPVVPAALCRCVRIRRSVPPAADAPPMVQYAWQQLYGTEAAASASASPRCAHVISLYFAARRTCARRVAFSVDGFLASVRAGRLPELTGSDGNKGDAEDGDDAQAPPQPPPGSEFVQAASLDELCEALRDKIDSFAVDDAAEIMYVGSYTVLTAHDGAPAAAMAALQQRWRRHYLIMDRAVIDEDSVGNQLLELAQSLTETLGHRNAPPTATTGTAVNEAAQRIRRCIFDAGVRDPLAHGCSVMVAAQLDYHLATLAQRCDTAARCRSYGEEILAIVADAAAVQSPPPPPPPARFDGWRRRRAAVVRAARDARDAERQRAEDAIVDAFARRLAAAAVRHS